MKSRDVLGPSKAAMVVQPVLVVDDSRAQRRLLVRALQRWGYDAVDAASGEAALDLVRALPIDIVISDWMMPGMSGVDFCRAFRELAEGRPAYFILLTARSESEVLAEGLESGADDFLSKPFNAVELRARLRAGERVVNAQKDLSAKNAALSAALRKLSDAYTAIDRDLRGARVFQEGLVPDRHFVLGGYEVSMLFRPSGHVGGDLVGHFRVNDSELGLYSVDVSGHGVASALMTARLAGYLGDGAPERNVALEPDGQGGYRMAKPEASLARLNRIFQSDGDNDHYLTLSLAHLNMVTGEVVLCQAGHPSPMVQRRDGSVICVEMFSTPIGLLDEGEFCTRRLTLEPGDRLILYSDGLTECPGPGGVLLEEEGLAEILRDTSGVHGPALVETIFDRLAAHRGSDDFPDDLSAVVIERL
ncbi:fused response regulator/phosphatase [Silicimonas algicola]|uniref:Sigma-B regulation protein RsbU (Phosphoserine phosphatase) n=1 Tax=Silicimonas algicola TaxID=1826607 RepID=A0A316G6C0_9RHOB|nr:SpoIIE family protein phosphatase [Silicimonas algicola]AZQ69433.1 fused response regulator/phosphatase [Silicimonas algicola]PWK56499.1 sigma-B regulation protein RsbU (phosphoserine phosphatase) [Silicimonas algicola]